MRIGLFALANRLLRCAPCLVAFCAISQPAFGVPSDEVFCDGFESVTICSAAPFMVVPNRASNLATTPFSTYLSAGGTATDLTLIGPSAETVSLTISGQTGNRVDAVIPAGLAAGLWTVQTMVAGNTAQLSQGLLITSETTSLSLVGASPAAISSQALSRVDLRATDPAPSGSESFTAMPEIFLQLHNSTANVVRIDDRDFVSAAQVEISVPAGLAAGSYDIIAINADGTTGVLTNGLTISANAAPLITRRTPGVSPATSGQVIAIYGANFGAAAPNVSASCIDTFGNPQPVVFGVVGPATASSVSVTFNFATLAFGDMCRLDLTTADGQVASFSSQPISNPALNLGVVSPAGQTLLQGRRGGVLLAGPVAPEGHRLYMIGGDNGTTAGAMSSVESAAIGAYGVLGAFRAETNSLPQALTFAAGVTAGDYLYVVGGNNGSAQVNTAYRARVLRDLRDPSFATLGATPALTSSGVGPGLWRYRVAPLLTPTDLDNPGGEGLPGAELSVEVPTLSYGVDIVLTWSTTIANVASYAVYRSPSAGDPTFGLLAIVPFTAGTTSYTDTGTATSAGQSPLPVGSLARWLTLPPMGTNREGAGIATAADPSNPAQGYIYVIGGKSGSTAVATSYEFLPFTVAPDGEQTIGSWTSGAQPLGSGRAYLGVWAADAENMPALISNSDTYVLAGPGANGTGFSVNAVDAGKVAVNGDLGAWDTTPKDVPTIRIGSCAAQADTRLYLLGGANGVPSTGVIVATMTAPPPTLTAGSWNNEGASLVHGVVFAGSTTTDGFIFIAGGQTDEPSAASNFVQRVQQ